MKTISLIRVSVPFVLCLLGAGSVPAFSNNYFRVNVEAKDFIIEPEVIQGPSAGYAGFFTGADAGGTGTSVTADPLNEVANGRARIVFERFYGPPPFSEDPETIEVGLNLNDFGWVSHDVVDIF